MPEEIIPLPFVDLLYRPGGLLVGVSSGKDFITNLWATWETYPQMKVLVGDFNGDGKDDVMKFDIPSEGKADLGLWVGLSDGTQFNTSNWASWETYQEIKVLVGDFNGDGKDDVIKFDVPSQGKADLGLWVGLSDGTKFNTSKWAIWENYKEMKVLVGDFNGDGKDDVMKFDVPSQGKADLGLWVGLSDGTKFNTSKWATWETYQEMIVLVGDFNGDGRDDIIKFDMPSQGKADLGLWVGLSDGTKFNTSKWATWETYQEMIVLVGDFNGDGRDDIIKFDMPSQGKADLGLWVGLSGGANFKTTKWATWVTYQAMKVLAGRFRGERCSDVMKIDLS